MTIYVLIEARSYFDGDYVEDWAGTGAQIVYYSKNKQECEVIKGIKENEDYNGTNSYVYIIDTIEL